jgi:membrane protease YdiL (CAAX protease family)
VLWAPLWLPRFGITALPVIPFHHALGALGPVTAAFIVSALESGVAGPRDLLRRMGLWRGQTVWLLLALCGPFVLLALAVLAARLFVGEDASLAGVGVSREFPQFSALGFLVYNVVTYGYGEETGWRGFVLPRLQARHSALVATVLLTVGWALWHAPLFLYRPGYTSMGIPGIIGWFVSLLTGAVLLTWLFNESRGSILVVALFHATVDVAFTSDISSPFVVNAAGALITLVGLAVLIVAGPRDLARAGKIVRPFEGGGVTAFVARESTAPPGRESNEHNAAAPDVR